MARPGNPANGWTPIPDPTSLTTDQLRRELTALKELVYTRLDGMDRAIVVFNESMTRVPTDTDKQIAHLKELIQTEFDERVNGLRTEQANATKMMTDVEATRHESMVSTLTQMQERTERLPHEVDIRVGHLGDVTAEKFRTVQEKFASIQTQFTERDTRTEQTSRDSKVAVDAALQAAKEAVGEQNKSSALAIAKSEAATTKQIDQITTLIQTTTKGSDDKIDDIKGRLTLIEGKGAGQAQATTSHQTSTSATMGLVGGVVGILSLLVAVIFDIIRTHP